MTRNHIAICGANNRPGRFVLLVRDAGGQWSTISSPSPLDGPLATALALLRERQGNFTFSSRPLEEIAIIEEQAEFTAAAPGASLTLFAPVDQQRSDGIAPRDLWGRCWRDPRMGIWSEGQSGRFRLVMLEEQITEFFKREDIRSFAPATSPRSAI